MKKAPKQTTNKFFDQLNYQYLVDKYQKLTITKSELSEELGVSVRSINNAIVRGSGVPEYIKMGESKNSTVVFPIVNVVEYMGNTIKVVS
jgi:hypothetical protein